MARHAQPDRAFRDRKLQRTEAGVLDRFLARLALDRRFDRQHLPALARGDHAGRPVGVGDEERPGSRRRGQHFDDRAGRREAHGDGRLGVVLSEMRHHLGPLAADFRGGCGAGLEADESDTESENDRAQHYDLLIKPRVTQQKRLIFESVALLTIQSSATFLSDTRHILSPILTHRAF